MHTNDVQLFAAVTLRNEIFGYTLIKHNFRNV